MAVGDEATAAGYTTVPDTGEDGRVRHGAREINRTRDFLALVKKLIPANKAAYRAAAGITYGTAPPRSPAPGANEGDIYLQIIE